MGSWWEIGYTANCVIYWSWGFNMIQWFYYEQLGFIQANMESWPTINRNMGWVDSYCTILNIHQSQLFGIHHDTGIAEGGIIQMWFRWILNFWCSSWKIKTWEIHDQNLGCVRCGNFSHRPKKKNAAQNVQPWTWLMINDQEDDQCWNEASNGYSDVHFENVRLQRQTGRCCFFLHQRGPKKGYVLVLAVNTKMWQTFLYPHLDYVFFPHW